MKKNKKQFNDLTLCRNKVKADVRCRKALTNQGLSARIKQVVLLYTIMHVRKYIKNEYL